MKVLFTLNSTNFGGMEKTVLDLVKNLPSTYTSFVVAPQGDMVLEFKKNSDFTQYRPIKAFDLEYFKFLYKFIKDKGIDVVHANEPRIVFHTLIASYFAGVKVRISHTHTPISHWRIPFFKKLINLVTNTTVVNIFSTYEVALTKYIKQEKEKEFILSSKLVVIPNCLDSGFISSVLNYQNKNTFRKSYKIEDRFIITVLSRLTREKNQNLVIEAMLELSKKYPNIILLIVGKGEDYEFLKKKVVSLNLEKYVKFFNQVSESEKIDFYSNTDLFIFPSLAEGFGITILEAMYCTSPILSSDLKVLKEVTGHKIDYFKSNNKKSLISKIKAFLDNKKLKIRDYDTIKNNREFINQNYSTEKYISNYIRLYNREV